MKKDFWDYLQELVDTSEIIIDRPTGYTHPRYPEKEYPVDYGYLKWTNSNDSSEVDVWRGSLEQHKVVGILNTVDLIKRDAELKILIDCLENEISSIIDFLNSAHMRAIYLKRD